MPNKAEHPRTLANELEFIANNKKLVLTPINYYIVSADKRRQKSNKGGFASISLYEELD